MLDKQERNMLFPGQLLNFSSVGPDTSHFQNNDMTNSSYFIDMDTAEEISKKRKFLNLDNIDNPGISPVICGNNQYYEKANFAVGQQTEFASINKALLSNLRPAYFQQKEPSLYQETYMEEISNLRNFQHMGRVTQLEQSGYQPEYSCDLVSTFLLDHDKQQGGVIIPHLPGALESSSSELACLEKEKLKNNAYASKELESIYLGKQDALTNGHKFQFQVDRSLYVNASLNSEIFSGSSDGFSAIMDEQNKPTMRLSPVISEKIWDGSLKLNTSTTVSAVAFFKRYGWSPFVGRGGGKMCCCHSVTLNLDPRPSSFPVSSPAKSATFVVPYKLSLARFAAFVVPAEAAFALRRRSSAQQSPLSQI